MRRRIWCLLLLVFLLPGRAAAAQEGSLRLTMRINGDPVSGGTVVLYDVTDLAPDSDAEQLARYARLKLEPLQTGYVNGEGEVRFDSLPPGRYLLVQEEASAGCLPLRPFLFSVPIRIGDETVYQIEAAPKLSPLPNSSLPQTGQILWPIWALGGMGILLLGIGILIGKKE